MVAEEANAGMYKNEVERRRPLVRRLDRALELGSAVTGGGGASIGDRGSGSASSTLAQNQSTYATGSDVKKRGTPDPADEDTS